MGPRPERCSTFDPDCNDLWGIALGCGRVDPIFERENHGDARRSGYANGILSPSLGFGFLYTVLMIVQWS